MTFFLFWALGPMIISGIIITIVGIFREKHRNW